MKLPTIRAAMHNDTYIFWNADIHSVSLTAST